MTERSSPPEAGVGRFPYKDLVLPIAYSGEERSGSIIRGISTLKQDGSLLRRGALRVNVLRNCVHAAHLLHEPLNRHERRQLGLQHRIHLLH